MPLSITIESDDANQATRLARHAAAFFGRDFPVDEDCEYWCIPVDTRTRCLLYSEVTKKTSIYNAGVLYRPYTPGVRGDTPYTRLWGYLRDLLPPRVYTMVKAQFDLDNKSYSKFKYHAAKGVHQHELEF